MSASVTNKVAAIGVNNRSSIANGTRYFPARRHGGPDLRSRSGRRWRDLYFGFIDDLGRRPTTLEDAQIRQAATLALRLEELSGQAASGGAINHDDLVRLSNALARMLHNIGVGSVASSTMVDTDIQQRRLEDREAGLA